MKFKIRIVESKNKMSCPRATQDLEYNTNMRDKAIKAKHIQLLLNPILVNKEKYEQ